jgi:hypothetical protein
MLGVVHHSFACRPLTAVLLGLLMSACGADSSGDDDEVGGDAGQEVTEDVGQGGTDSGGGGTPDPDVSCNSLIAEQFGSGGCRLYLVSPQNCEAIDFSATGYVEFAWSTDGSFCEGPHKFFLAGHPESTWASDNGFIVELSSTDGNFTSLGNLGSEYAMTRNLGGVVRLVEGDLQGITTTTGQYHWTVAGFYALDNGGSIAASGTFTVR